MITDMPAITTDEIRVWIHNEAATKGFGDAFEAVFIRQENEWYHFAVRMDAPAMPIFRSVELLRGIEDKWDNEHPGSRLLLVPSAG